MVAGHTEMAAAAFAQVRVVQHCAGAVSSPFDAWLTLRGMRSLGARMRVHSENAMAVASFLDEHKVCVARVGLGLGLGLGLG